MPRRRGGANVHVLLLLLLLLLLFSHMSSCLVSGAGGHENLGTRSHVKPPIAADPEGPHSLRYTRWQEKTNELLVPFEREILYPRPPTVPKGSLVCVVVSNKRYLS